MVKTDLPIDVHDSLYLGNVSQHKHVSILMIELGLECHYFDRCKRPLLLVCSGWSSDRGEFGPGGFEWLGASSGPVWGSLDQ